MSSRFLGLEDLNPLMNKRSGSQIKWYTLDVPCRKCSRCKTLLFPPLIFSYCRISNAFTRTMYTFRSHLNQGILTLSKTDHEKLGSLENNH